MTGTLKAEIICVGTELLLGQIVNTNAAWLASQLSLAGVYSYYQTVVGDNKQRLAASIRQAAGRADLVILTGGLGPTQDDITMATAAAVAGQRLILHQPSRQAIAAYFTRMGRRQVTDNNWKQALMPEKALVLPNNNGTAPGAIIEYKSKEQSSYLILLPGPPAEMQLMYQESVLPWLKHKSGTRLKHVFVRLIGIGESTVENELLDLITNQQNPTLAPYAQTGEVMLRISQAFTSLDEPDLTSGLLAELKARLGAYIYEIGPRSMVEVLFDLLRSKGQTISYAESCTGGLASAQLTDLPGSSAVLAGSLVAYSNRIKAGILGVNQALLDSEGAVSQAVVLEMAQGCRQLFATDWAVAISGIAGPDGGSPAKPVGTVWLAVAGEGIKESVCLQLSGNRARIRQVAALNAHNLVRKQLVQ